MGRFGEAEHELTRAREVAKQHQQLDLLCSMEAVTVLLGATRGNVVRRPLDHARSAIELAEKVGNAFVARRGERGHSEWLMASPKNGRRPSQPWRAR